MGRKSSPFQQQDLRVADRALDAPLVPRGEGHEPDSLDLGRACADQSVRARREGEPVDELPRVLVELPVHAEPARALSVRVDWHQNAGPYRGAAGDSSRRRAKQLMIRTKRG